MAIAQSTYGTSAPNGYAGMVATGERDNRIVRTIEDAAGIGFGKAAFRGAGDHGCTGTPAAGVGAFLGVTIEHHAPQVNATTGAMEDKYPQYASVPILSKGSIWIVTGAAVLDGEQVYVTAAGAFTNVLTGNTILTGWFFDMTVASGGLCRIVNRG